MNGRRSLLHVAAVLACARAAPGALAAPTGVEPFSAGTWARWRAEVEATRRPQLAVFVATWCSTCPTVVQLLAEDEARRRRGVPLAVVVTDVQAGDDDAGLRAHPHLRSAAAADRLLAFDGVEAALRHAVDPGWRGVVPLVAWLAPGTPPMRVQGTPSADQRRRWLGA